MSASELQNKCNKKISVLNQCKTSYDFVIKLSFTVLLGALKILVIRLSIAKSFIIIFECEDRLKHTPKLHCLLCLGCACSALLTTT
jgi:hypothetical protein